MITEQNVFPIVSKVQPIKTLEGNRREIIAGVGDGGNAIGGYPWASLLRKCMP